MSRSTAVLLILVPALALAAQALAPGPGGALPLFSRQTSQPCSQCHLAVPRLNTFGARYLQNGYRREGETGQAPWSVGAFPLSVIANLGYEFTAVDTADLATGARGRRSEGEFRQNSIEIRSAGTLSPRLSYHFEGSVASAGGAVETGTAFVQFDDLVRAGGLNLKAGVFDIDTPYLAESRRTTLHSYLAPVTLEGRGLELNGSRASWIYGAGLIDSDRHLANARPGTRTFNRFEDTYLWLMRDLGGQRVAGRMLFDRQDSNLSFHTWLQHLQAAASARLMAGRFEVIPAYVFNRFDDRPAAGRHDAHHIGLLEATVPVDANRRWVLTARFEHEYRVATTFNAEEDHHLAVLNLAYYVAPNALLGVEWSHAGDNIGGPRVSALNVFVRAGS